MRCTFQDIKRGIQTVLNQVHLLHETVLQEVGTIKTKNPNSVLCLNSKHTIFYCEFV